jgi:hypothetical protein
MAECDETAGDLGSDGDFVRPNAGNGQSGAVSEEGEGRSLLLRKPLQDPA